MRAVVFTGCFGGSGPAEERPADASACQADVLNLTNRLNVINFAGLFSGTAIGAPRSFSIRLSAEF